MKVERIMAQIQSIGRKLNTICILLEVKELSQYERDRLHVTLSNILAILNHYKTG